MYARNYRIHLVNGEILRVSESTDGEASPILDQYLGTKENEFLILGSLNGPDAYIPMRNILYLSVREFQDE